MPALASAICKSVTRSAQRSAEAMLSGLGVFKADFQRLGCLRILGYHGVCNDEVAGEQWVPSYFVSASQFAAQMSLLCRYGPVVSLSDMFTGRENTQSQKHACFAVTFDDVPACTVDNALPILQHYGIKATFFVSTNNVAAGRLFPANVFELLQCIPDLMPADPNGQLATSSADPAVHKRMNLEQLTALLEDIEKSIRETVEPRIIESLRPVTWTETLRLAQLGHDIGGHTCDHAILGSQTASTRRSQIINCISDLTAALGHRPHGFAYPNGGPGDYDESDQELLRSQGIHYAVSTRSGAVTRNDCPYDLPRTCIGLQHTLAKFSMELSGRLDKRRRRQQGWP